MFFSSLAFAEGPATINGVFTIEAIADVSTSVYLTSVGENGEYRFELREIRDEDGSGIQSKPTHEELVAAIEVLKPAVRDQAVVFTIGANPVPELREYGVRDWYPPGLGRCYAIQMIDVDDWNRVKASGGRYDIDNIGRMIIPRDGVLNPIAFDNTGRALLSRDRLFQIVKERFATKVTSKLPFFAVGRTAYCLKSRPDLVWYDFPPIVEDIPDNVRARLVDDKLDDELVEVPLDDPKFFFAEPKLRGALVNMLRKGDAPRRRYAAVRLRAFNDAEIIDLLSDVSKDGFVGKPEDAEKDIVDCLRPIAEKSTSINDIMDAALNSLAYLKNGMFIKRDDISGHFDWPRLSERNVFSLDVESLEKDWMEK